MAVIAFYEPRGSRSGEINSDWERGYDRTYIAVTNSADDHEPEIWQHPDCPVLNRAPKWDNLSKCDKLSAKLKKSRPGRYWWEVTAHFSSVQFGEAAEENPLNDPAEVEIESDLVTEERYFDRKGNPTTNTAGDLIKVQVEIPRNEIQVTKNISVYSAWIKQIEGMVNSAPVRIKGILWETGTLKVSKVHIGKDQFRNKIGFMVCKVSIKHKAEGWDSTALNVGYYELRPDPTGTAKDKKGNPALIRWRCLTAGLYGEPESQPVFLDAKGRRPTMKVTQNGIEKEMPKYPLDPKDIIVLKFGMIEEIDFRKLPLA